jgi:hypothetical protein
MDRLSDRDAETGVVRIQSAGILPGSYAAGSGTDHHPGSGTFSRFPGGFRIKRQHVFIRTGFRGLISLNLRYGIPAFRAFYGTAFSDKCHN